MLNFTRHQNVCVCEYTNSRIKIIDWQQCVTDFKGWKTWKFKFVFILNSIIYFYKYLLKKEFTQVTHPSSVRN